MNTRYNMIIIKGEIKTPDIISCMYNSYTKKMDVKFYNEKTYSYFPPAVVRSWANTTAH